MLTPPSSEITSASNSYPIARLAPPALNSEESNMPVIRPEGS